MRRALGAVRPDPIAFATLAVLAAVLFSIVHFPPDLVRDVTAPPPGIAAAPPSHVQDFDFVFNYARYAVDRPGVSPYTYAAHRDFYRAWLGSAVHSALCFTFGPTTMLVLALLFPLATAPAWLAWNLASAWLMGWAVRVLPEGDPHGLGLARLTAVSPTTFLCLTNGQSALFTTGCLAAAVRPADAAPGDAARTLGSAVCLFALGVKPPLAVIAMLALMASGRARPVLLAVALAAASALLFACYWTPTVFGDYASLLSHYNLVDADEIVRAGCVPGAMSNLRSVFLRTGWLDDSWAFRVSGWVLVVSLVPPIWAAGRRRRWPVEIAISWVVVAYLLFAPHLSPTEDVLLLLPLVLLRRQGYVAGRDRAATVVGCLGPQWLNNSGVGIGQMLHAAPWIDALPLAAFALKLGVGIVVVKTARRTVGRDV